MALNQANDYTVSNEEAHVEYAIAVRFMDAPSPTPFVLTKVSNTKYRLTCQDYGYFKIEYTGKYNNYSIDGTSFTVICIP